MSLGADELAHLIRQNAAAQQQSHLQVIYGHIASYDPNLHRVRVMFPSLTDDSGQVVQSSWMPLGGVWVGPGYGIQIAPFGGASVADPTAGEQCMVLLVERKYGASAVACLMFNQTMQPPAGKTIKPGEMVIQGPGGQTVQFHQDKSISVASPEAVNVTAPTINIGAQGETLHKLVWDTILEALGRHVHSDGTGAGGNTGPPTESFDSGNTTTALNAG